MKKDSPLNIPIFLASKSPRRSQLLTEAGFKIQVIPLDVEEKHEKIPNKKVAGFLAEKKGKAFQGVLPEDSALISADSIVLLKGKILGKPESLQDAKKMLKKLSGKAHFVITGVYIYYRGKSFTFQEKTKVKMANLSEEEIDFYVESYKPLDKAGSYGIQEWIGLNKVEWIRGTFSNVMGLPVQSIYEKLSNWS
jgi:septum formation protein